MRNLSNLINILFIVTLKFLKKFKKYRKKDCKNVSKVHILKKYIYYKKKRYINLNIFLSKTSFKLSEAKSKIIVFYKITRQNKRLVTSCQSKFLNF